MICIRLFRSFLRFAIDVTSPPLSDEEAEGFRKPKAPSDEGIGTLARAKAPSDEGAGGEAA